MRLLLNDASSYPSGHNPVIDGCRGGFWTRGIERAAGIVQSAATECPVVDQVKKIVAPIGQNLIIDGGRTII